MTTLEAAGVYIAVNILLIVYLALRVVRLRFSTGTSIGDGGHEPLSLAVRVHGNATEYIPVVLIGLLAIALLDGPALMIHVVGGTFTFGRLLHAFGLSTTTLNARKLGIILSWLGMLATTGCLLWLIFS